MHTLKMQPKQIEHDRKEQIDVNVIINRYKYS